MQRLSQMIAWWTLVGAVAGISGAVFFFLQIWLVRKLVVYIGEVERARDGWREAFIERKSL